MNVTPLIMWLCLQRGYVSDVSWELLAYHTPFRSSADLKTIQMHLMFGRQWWNQFSEVHALAKITEYRQVTGSQSSTYIRIYEGWNFNFGNAAVTFDTAYLQSSYFHRPWCTPQSYVEHVPSDEGVAWCLWQPLFCWWSGRSGLQRKAWTHLATVLYGNAAVPQASSSPR